MLTRERCAALVSALEGYACEPGDIYAGLAGVAFRGGVSLIRASRSGYGVRRVVLHGVAPYLKALRGIVGWDCTPGLVLHERHSTPVWPGSVTGGGCMPARRVVPCALGRTIMVPSAAPGSMLERRC
jgi:hypothetical protein